MNTISKSEVMSARNAKDELAECRQVSREHVVHHVDAASELNLVGNI